MVAQRALFLLACLAALLAICSSIPLPEAPKPPAPRDPEGEFLGYVTHKGKVIGDVYAINRTTLRIDNLNLSGTDGDIVSTFGYTPTPYVTSKKVGARIFTPRPNKTTAVPPTRGLDRVLLQVPAGINAPLKELPGGSQLRLIRTSALRSDNKKDLFMEIPPQRLNEYCKIIIHNEPPITDLTALANNAPKPRVRVTVVCLSAVQSTLLPSTASLSPTTATSTAGATSLSSTVTSTAGNKSLLPTATSTVGATSLSPSATASVSTISPTAVTKIPLLPPNEPCERRFTKITIHNELPNHLQDLVKSTPKPRVTVMCLDSILFPLLPTTTSLSPTTATTSLAITSQSLTATLSVSATSPTAAAITMEMPTPTPNEYCKRGITKLPINIKPPNADLWDLVIRPLKPRVRVTVVCQSSMLSTLPPNATSLSPTTATSTVGATSLLPTATASVSTISPTAVAVTTEVPLPPLNELCNRRFTKIKIHNELPNLQDLVKSAPKPRVPVICLILLPLPPTTTSLSPTAATTSAAIMPLSPTATSTTSPSPSVTPLPVWNCSKLTNGYGVCWENIRRSVKFILCANDIGPGEYMAFGWSRKFRQTTMVKADAVVCSHHINGTWDVEDYYLESRQPCGTNERGETVGVCPDTAFGGDSNIAGTSGFYDNGVGYCTFKRRLYTSRKHDMTITAKKKQAIVWAIGPVDADGQIQKHSKRAGADTQFFSFVRGGQQCKLGDPKLCCDNIIQQ